jgi:hypothetical protein
VDVYDLLVPSGGAEAAEADEDEDAAAEDEDAETEFSSSTFRLKPWNKRKRPGMGYDPSVDSPSARREAAQPALFADLTAPKPRARMVPMIDQVHRLMHLWKSGDVVKVDEYLDQKGLRSNALFPQLLQALIELSEIASEERSILESLSRHVQARSAVAQFQPELAEQRSRAEGEIV